MNSTDRLREMRMRGGGGSKISQILWTSFKYRPKGLAFFVIQITSYLRSFFHRSSVSFLMAGLQFRAGNFVGRKQKTDGRKRMERASAGNETRNENADERERARAPRRKERKLLLP